MPTHSCTACGHNWNFKGAGKARCPKCKSWEIVEIPLEAQEENLAIATPLEEKQEEKAQEEKITITAKQVGAGLDFIGLLLSKLVGDWILLSEEEHKAVDQPTADVAQKVLAPLGKASIWLTFAGAWVGVGLTKYQAYKATKATGTESPEVEEEGYLEKIRAGRA